MLTKLDILTPIFQSHPTEQPTVANRFDSQQSIFHILQLRIHFKEQFFH
jgi:hypothetical protein